MLSLPCTFSTLNPSPPALILPNKTLSYLDSVIFLSQEYSNGKLFLYGGLDPSNKPLNDAWIFDVSTSTWECVYAGHSDQVSLCVEKPSNQLAGEN